MQYIVDITKTGIIPEFVKLNADIVPSEIFVIRNEMIVGTVSESRLEGVNNLHLVSFSAMRKYVRVSEYLHEIPHRKAFYLFVNIPLRLYQSLLSCSKIPIQSANDSFRIFYDEKA